MKTKPNYEHYTEKNLSKQGYYYFYPEFPHLGNQNRYVFFHQSDLDDLSYLQCKNYQGVYFGPIEPPANPLKKD